MLQFVEVPAKKRASQLFWPGSWLAVTMIGLFLHPDPGGHGTHRQLGLPQCPSVTFFGRPCPGCGLTTSWTNLLHGHIWESFMNNAVGPLLYLSFTLMALVATVAFFRGKYWDTNTKLFNLVSSAVLITFLVYGGVRFAMTRYPGPAIVEIFGRPGSPAAQRR